MRKFMTIERFRYVFTAYIVYASVKTIASVEQIVAAHPAHALLARSHLVVLGSVEILFAVGLLVPRLRFASAIGLLLVFGTAGAIDLSLGEVPLHLVLYAAATLLLCGAEGAGNTVRAGAA